ncbi:PepSY-like domain-containing protein [uncultured Chryseobacterium sp.]|uniref:PepSY-like domain-containing protein n=1 Tax=uncultured Chryseobacterium sp. TaxID=259322 RepID=UPI0025F52A3C|nr:PepSY-like domain-containing protein [uncultured Chryseobacterium sp.]
MEKKQSITIMLGLILTLMTGCVYGQDRVINQNQLPKTAKNFLLANFRGVPIASAIEDREIDGVDEYKVRLGNGMKVEFDSKGNWKEVDGEHQKVPNGFVPAAIRNYVAKNFPNTYMTKIKKERWKYKADLSNGLDIEFDRNGNFSKIDD